MSVFVLSELERYAAKRSASSVMFRPVSGRPQCRTAMYLGPFQGRHLASAYITCSLVYLVFKLKPYSGRLRQQIFFHVGCPQAMVDPGVAKVVAIAAILPRYRHVKYCGAFLGIK